MKAQSEKKILETSDEFSFRKSDMLSFLWDFESYDVIHWLFSCYKERELYIHEHTELWNFYSFMYRLTTRTRISRPDPVLFWVRIRMKWDFFLMRWNRIRFFFMRWDETENENNFNEMKSNFFSVRWNRIRFIFCEIKQNQISI